MTAVILYKAGKERGLAWQRYFERRDPGIEFRVWPDAGDPAEIRYLAVWDAIDKLDEHASLSDSGWPAGLGRIVDQSGVVLGGNDAQKAHFSAGQGWQGRGRDKIVGAQGFDGKHGFFHVVARRYSRWHQGAIMSGHYLDGLVGLDK